MFGETRPRHRRAGAGGFLHVNWRCSLAFVRASNRFVCFFFSVVFFSAFFSAFFFAFLVVECDLCGWTRSHFQSFSLSQDYLAMLSSFMGESTAPSLAGGNIQTREIFPPCRYFRAVLLSFHDVDFFRQQLCDCVKLSRAVWIPRRCW